MIVIESDRRGMLQRRPIMQIVALPLNCIRWAILMLDFPGSAKRERAQITRPTGVLDYSVSPDRLFVSSGNRTNVLHVTWNHAKNVENLFRLHNYLFKMRIFKQFLILHSRYGILNVFFSFSQLSR